MLTKANCGQSVIEVIVAVSILTIIAASSVIAILGSFTITRLAQEETKATFLATEGLEAVKSIRDQKWSNLVNGTWGLAISGNAWLFSGNSDTSGKYNRSVVVQDILRDANDDIAQTGTLDLESKKIIVSVIWDFTPTRNENITMTEILTDWQKAKGATGGISPSPTPSPTTCAQFCTTLNYQTGACRQNTSACNKNNETYESGGDIYCSAPPIDTCCCLP